MNTQTLSGAIRWAIGSSAAVAAAIVAQDVWAQAPSEDPEEVIVTGSRIARGSDFESPAPVLTVDQENIQRSGYNNLQQLMEKLPAAGTGTFSTRGNNQDSTANGAASISLRGLGADATLVLVNGRRVAISAFAENVSTNFVDINSIPVAAIQRVEVLKDGSSAVYGSDAIAGVVNIILRNDFDGLELSGGYGAADGYDETTASLVWGIDSDDSNVTFILDYFKNTSLFNSERGYMGTADQSPRGGQDLRSSRGYPGSFVVNGAQQVDPSCPPDRVAGALCVFDFGSFNVLIPEAERTGLLVMAEQQLNEGVQLFGEIAAQHNTSLAQGAPTPLDEQALLTVPATHPNNPFAGASTIAIRRYRTVDAGPRQWDIETNNLRGVLGFRGDLGGWNWEVAAQRAQSDSEQTGDRSQGWVRTDLLQAEIDAGRYNPFGGVQNPQSVIDAITTNLVRRGEAELESYEASVTGELFEMPGGGKVQMAVGAEYREESVSDIPDDQFQRGLIFGTEAVSANAARDIKALYVEFSVPITEGLELSLAGRYDDYSDFGDTTNPKVAVRWAPIESLAFRASWGTGFRAPSLAQIGLGPSEESQFFIDTYGCAAGIEAACRVLDYNIEFTGNPDLDAEESETFNIGVAYQPTDRIELTLDYWDILQDNKIDEAPFGLIYDQFCATQDSEECQRGTPLPGDTLGPLQIIQSTFINIGEQSARGIDLGGYFGMTLGPGELTLGLSYSRLLEFEKVEPDGDGVLVARALEGEYEYPEDRALLTADFGTDAFGVFASVNYIGPFQDTPDVDFDGTLDYDLNDTPELDSYTTVNLQLRYTGFEGMRFLVGVDNVFDEMPPFAAGDGDTDLYGYVQSIYLPRGRFWNAKAIFNF